MYNYFDVSEMTEGDVMTLDSGGHGWATSSSDGGGKRRGKGDNWQGERKGNLISSLGKIRSNKKKEKMEC